MVLNIVISGTDHGLGASLATLLADRGHRVLAGVLSPREPEEPRDRGGVIRRVVLDIADGASVARAAEVARSWGRVDWLINNAAVLGDIDATLDQPLDFAQMARVYDVNVLGTLRVTQAFLPLLAQGENLVVNVSSEAGSIAGCHRTGWFAYASSKAALNLQSALVHNTLRPRGGRVVVVHPGHVRTFMRGAEDTSGALSPDEAAALLVENIERGRHWEGEGPPFWGPGGEVLPW